MKTKQIYIDTKDLNIKVYVLDKKQNSSEVICVYDFFCDKEKYPMANTIPKYEDIWRESKYLTKKQASTVKRAIVENCWWFKR